VLIIVDSGKRPDNHGNNNKSGIFGLAWQMGMGLGPWYDRIGFRIRQVLFCQPLNGFYGSTWLLCT